MKIINSMIDNKYIPAKQLSEIIKISERKVKENIKKLKDIGILKRIGPKLGGYWEIIK